MKFSKKMGWSLAGIPVFALMACMGQDPSGPGPHEPGVRNELAVAASTSDWNIGGAWCVTQGSYHGTLYLGQAGTQLDGTMDWSNHADAGVTGQITSTNDVDTAQMYFAYNPNLVGDYRAARNDATANSLWGYTYDIVNGGPVAEWSATLGACQ